MNIKTVEEECKDTSIGTIEDEIEMFFGSKAERFVFQDKYFYLKGTDICLSGDNLITKKQMWRRIHHRRKTPQNIENDKIFSSYIILPRIRNDYRSNVNNVRNSTYGYNDNPFLFFKALRNMYICELDKSKASKPLDYVEKAIIQTNFFGNCLEMEKKAMQNVSGLFASVEFWNYVRTISIKNSYVKRYQKKRNGRFMKLC